MKITNLNKITGFKLYTLVWFLSFMLMIPMLIIYSPVGPNHDELWNLYSAPGVGLGSTSWTKVNIKILGIQAPLLSGPYHGALKSFLFSPLLAITRDIDVIRFANCALLMLITPIYLWSTQIFIAKPVFNYLYAIMAVFFLPVMYINAPADTGQFILPALLLGLAFGATFRGDATQMRKWYYLAYLCGLLSIYEKLTVLNFAAPVCVYAAYRLLWPVVGRRLDIYIIITLFILPIFIFSPYIIYFYFFSGWPELTGMTASPEASFTANLVLNFFRLPQFVFGIGQIHTLHVNLGKSPDFWFLGLLLACLTTLSIFITFVIKFRLVKDDSRRQVANVLLYLVGIFLAAIIVQSLVNGLNRPWHYSPYWILILFFIGIGLQSAYTFFKLRWVSYALLTVATTCSFVNMEQMWIFSSQESPLGIASPSVFDIVKMLETDSQGSQLNLVCLDYSVCSPIAFMLGRKAKIVADFAFFSRDPELLLPMIDKSMAGGVNRVLITRILTAQHEPESYLKFMNSGSRIFMDSSDMKKYIPIGSFQDRSGTNYSAYLRNIQLH